MNALAVVAAVVLALSAGCHDKARENGQGSGAPASGSAATGSATTGSATTGSATTGSATAGSAPAPVDAGPPANVVQTEMRMLTEICEHTVRGIGLGDVRAIEGELHRLHEAKEATEAAVKSGAYKLPKNADKLEAFEAMDEAFHGQLGALVKASAANDVPAAADALGAIVRGCPSCHAMFRP